MSQDGASVPLAVVVLGMHRSGTSALARLLNLLGVDLGTNLLGASVDNPKGFWEHRAILDTHTELLETLGSFFDDFLPLPDNWHIDSTLEPHRRKLAQIIRDQFAGKSLWGFKDPRTCRLVPLWTDLLASAQVDARFILMVRNPDEIAKSLAVRNGYSYNKSLLLTLTHMLEAERQTRSCRRTVVSFDQVMADWRACAQSLSRALGVDWPISPDRIAQQAADFLDPSLRHHAAGTRGTAQNAVQLHGADPDIARWTFAVYEHLAAVAIGTAVDAQRLDALRAEFVAQIPRLTAWRQHRSIDQKFMLVESWGQRLDAAVKHLSQENQSLRLKLAEAEKTPSVASNIDPAQANGLIHRIGASAKSRGNEARSAALTASNHALQSVVEQQNQEIAQLRQAVAERDGQITTLQTRQRELSVAQSWLMREKQAADNMAMQLKLSNSQLIAAGDRLVEENRRLIRWASQSDPVLSSGGIERASGIDAAGIR